MFAAMPIIAQSSGDAASAAGLMGFLFMLMLIMLIPAIVMIVSMWKIFEKAGEEGWIAIVPVYNTWKLFEISGKPGWWALLMFGGIVPFIGFFIIIGYFVLMVLAMIGLSQAFNKDTVFAVLLMLLPIVGFPILAFGDAEYVGPPAA